MKKKRRKQKLIIIFCVIFLMAICFFSLRYFITAHIKQIYAYSGRVQQLFISPKKNSKPKHNQQLATNQPQQDVAVEFQFYSALADMKVDVPPIDNKIKAKDQKKNSRAAVIHAEELENDVLKHIK